jgi:hypothetical protein
MSVLLNQVWPWIVVGLLFVSWGILSLQLNLRQWFKICISLFFNNFTDHTNKEKKELAATHLDDAVASNAGCMLLLIGLTCLMYGIIRWIT